MMRDIAFTGGRKYNDDIKVYEILKTINPDRVLVGDADGLDRLVRMFCRRLQIPYHTFKADWDEYGKAAGPIRNKEMLSHGPGILIAFPGGRGTENCVKQAKELGLVVLRVEE